MPRKRIPKLCACGCLKMTRGGEFLPGHDSRTLSAIVSAVGGVANLRRHIENSRVAQDFSYEAPHVADVWRIRCAEIDQQNANRRLSLGRTQNRKGLAINLSQSEGNWLHF